MWCDTNSDWELRQMQIVAHNMIEETESSSHTQHDRGNKKY